MNTPSKTLSSRFWIFSLVTVALVTSACAPVADPDLVELPSDEQDRLETLKAREDLMVDPDQTISGGCGSGVSVPFRAQQGILHLTFDDGPVPGATEKVLDVLKVHGISATFFVVGPRARAGHRIMKRMIREGHTIGNHSMSHPNFAKLGPGAGQRQITETHRILQDLGVTSKVFRYPYGIASCEGQSTLKKLGYFPTIGWHIDSCDWAIKDGSVDSREARVCGLPQGSVRFASSVVSAVRRGGGGVVLFHDIHDATANNLDTIIRELKRDGYRFESMDEMLGSPSMGLSQKRSKPTNTAAVAKPSADKSATETSSEPTVVVQESVKNKKPRTVEPEVLREFPTLGNSQSN